MTTIANLVIKQGSTFTAIITVENAATGALFDLSGWSARSQLRKSHNSDDISATFTATVDTDTSKITISLSSVQTANLAAGRYVYDVEIYDGSSPAVVNRVVEGTVLVKPEVTK